MSLGHNVSSWEATISAAPECLTSESSLKNVQHILSTAVTRTAQRILLHATLPHFRTMIDCDAGLGIIECLVKFGTPKTVSKICQHLLEIVTFPLTTAAMTKVAAAIATRVDDGSEPRTKFIESLLAIGLAEMMKSCYYLHPLSVIAANDSGVSRRLQSDTEAQKALWEGLNGAKSHSEASLFVERLLKSSSEDLKEASCSFVLSAIAPGMSKSATQKVRIDTLQIIALHGSEHLVTEVAKCLATWSLEKMICNEKGAKMLAIILSKCSQKAGDLLATQVVKAADIKSLASSKSTALMSVATVLRKRFSGICEKNHVPLDQLAASEIRLTKATKPTFQATKESIMDKIRQIRSQEDEPARKKARK